MDGEALDQLRDLKPLPYHKSVVDYLREHETEVWSWTLSQAPQDDKAQEVRSALLRETYRLDPAAHSEIHADCAAVMAKLGLDVPVTLYQAASDGPINAALFFLPGEAHLLFHGPVLEKLAREERIALIGHELAHYKLWTVDNGSYHIASQILDHALAYPGASASHIETARLYRLHTELYADRGGALAADDPAPAIATLIKTMTGLSSVDVESYLRQSAEIDAQAKVSKGETHPEIFMRAQALQKWWRSEPDVDDWVSSRVVGKLSMQTLDLRRQLELTRLTRGYLARLLADLDDVSETAIAAVQRFFPDWGNETPIDAAELAAQTDSSVRDYLFALSFDVAMADADAKDAILRAGTAIARGMDAEEAYRNAVGRDLRLPKRAVAKLLGAAKGAS